MANSSYSPSCQFGLFPLIPILAGFLLLTMAPQFCSALECYYDHVVRESSIVGRPAAAAAWQLNKLMNIATVNRALGVPANGGNETILCPTSFNYCISLHCQKYFGDKIVKSCAQFPGGESTAKGACNYWRKICNDDPTLKSYCRYCHTDKCNNDGE